MQKVLLSISLFLLLASNAAGQQRPYRPVSAELTDSTSCSMILYPDVQGYVKYAANQPILELMTQWTVSNLDKLNIKAVMCTGDLVEFNEFPVADPRMSDQNSVEQWKSTSKAFERLDGRIPYINCLGNHDYGYKSAEKRISNFAGYFPVDRNPQWKKCLTETALNYEGMNTLENAAYEFDLPNWGKILVISMEFSPRDEILTWAKGICDSPKYKNHKVIVLTHSYMDYQGNIYEKEGYKISPANYGKDIWERLVYPCSNIRMVICGHDARVGSFKDNVGYRTDRNKAGRNVSQMMFNAQTAGGGWEGNGGDGWLRILEFMPDGKTIKVRTFSPLLAISEAGGPSAWRTEDHDRFDIVLE